VECSFGFAARRYYAQLVEAMENLQQLNFQNFEAEVDLASFKQDSFPVRPPQPDLKLGNVDIGVFEDSAALLQGIIDFTYTRFKDNNTPTVHGSSQAGIRIETNDLMVASIFISADALQVLTSSIYLCHNNPDLATSLFARSMRTQKNYATE